MFACSDQFEPGNRTLKVVELCNVEAELKNAEQPAVKDYVVISCFLFGNILHGSF